MFFTFALESWICFIISPHTRLPISEESYNSFTGYCNNLSIEALSFTGLGALQAGCNKIAKYVANMNVDVVDLGVPVLSMHAPFEIVSKTDVYMAYRAFYSFFNITEWF